MASGGREPSEESGAGWLVARRGLGGLMPSARLLRQNRQAGERPVLDLLGDDFAEEGGLGAVGDLDVRQCSGEARVPFEDHNAVTGGAADELDRAGRGA